MPNRDPEEWEFIKQYEEKKLKEIGTFSISRRAMGWNSSLAPVKTFTASAWSTLFTSRNTGLQNFIRPFTTPEPSSPTTHFTAVAAKALAAEELGSRKTTS